MAQRLAIPILFLPRSRGTPETRRFPAEPSNPEPPNFRPDVSSTSGLYADRIFSGAWFNIHEVASRVSACLFLTRNSCLLQLLWYISRLSKRGSLTSSLLFASTTVVHNLDSQRVRFDSLGRHEFPHCRPESLNSAALKRHLNSLNVMKVLELF